MALIWTSGLDSIRTYFNQKWLDFTGHTLDQEIGNGWTTGVFADDLQGYLDGFLKAFDRRESISLTYRLLRYDGRYRWILDAACPRYDKNGDFAGYIGYCLDITEQRKEVVNRGGKINEPEKDASRENEMRFREVLEYSLDASYKRNIPTNSYDYLSPVFESISGYDPDEIARLSVEAIIDLIHPDDRADLERVINLSLSDLTHRPFQVEYRFKHKNGQYRWFQDRFAIKRLGNGQPMAYIGSVRDITDRKFAENALVESEEKYRIIFNNEIYAICIFDLETLRLLDVNAAYCHLYGYSREEIVSGMTIHDITAEHQSSDAATQHACNNGTIFIPLRYHRKKDGTVFPVEIVGGPYMWKGKNVMFGLAHDITDRKRAEDDIQDHRRRLASIIEGTNVGTWEWNVQTGETTFNERWAEIIGYRLDELLPISIKTWEKLTHPADLQHSIDLLARHFSGETPSYECEIRMKHKNGDWVWVLDRGRVMTRTSDDKPLMMYGTHSDVTKRKKTEEALQKAHNELELRVLQRTADLEKTNATLSMMLDYARKTEMEIQERVVANIRSNILGIIENLKKGKLEKNTRDLVEILEVSTRNLAHPLARNLESRLLKLTPRELELANFIQIGKSTKEIMALLNLSQKTVESHRNNLRKKLGIHNKKINLRTFLDSEFIKTTPSV